MRQLKLSLILGTLAVVGAAVWANAYIEGGAGVMVSAADRLLKGLDDEQREQVTFTFENPERLNWHFIPRDRRGLSFLDMSPEQRLLAFGLLQSGLSQAGNLKATTIMSLEAVLRELENDDGQRRNPDKYYFSIFGQPSNSGTWGWRVEGHHLSLNFTLKDGEIVSATPAFFGANPAEVRQGPRAGLRALGDREDRALRLLMALDDTQREKAIVAEAADTDVESNTGIGQTSPYGGLAITAPSDERVGILVGDLNDDQRAMLFALIHSYAEDMPDEVMAAWVKEVEQAGDDLSFAWYGAADRSQPHAYQIQGPTFQIEFNNTQNNANHIHSLWRNTLTDFAVAVESE